MSPKTAVMGRNKGWKCHLECHLMSGDFEDDDQYTSTIDDNLTKGKVVMSSVSAPTGKARRDALMAHQAALLEA